LAFWGLFGPVLSIPARKLRLNCALASPEAIGYMLAHE